MGLCSLILLGSCAVIAPSAGAVSTGGVAGVTDATTGLSDGASVVALDACGSPSATRAACLARVLGVRGSHSLVHPLLRRAASFRRLGGARRAHLATAATQLTVAAATAPQPGTPAYLQQAYDLAYLSQTAGAGTTVAVVDAFDDPTAEADLAAYRAKFSLPACSTANGCFSKVDQSGGTSYPSTVDSGWQVETSLDLDAVSALCPNCRIVLVEANSDSLSDLAAAEAQAAQQGASVISDSWAVAMSGRGAAQSFEASGTYTFPGVTTVAASGDDGYLGSNTNNYPAALGDVTAAGGTTLEPASSSHVSSARDFTETAWSGTGSGCARQVAKPSWQLDTGCTGRAYNDISADADPATGMQVYDSGDDGWLVVGGTSEATPLIAAYYALIGSAAQGPSWAYANAALLGDPSEGSNGSCTIAYICQSGSGYDGPTGAGSISGAVATGAPGIGGPGTNGSYSQSVSATTAQLQGGVYPNGADTSYWWEYGTTTSYGQQTPAVDIGSGNAPVGVSDAVGGLQPGTTYHYRLVAQNSFGTEYGYDFTLSTPGAGSGPLHAGTNAPDGPTGPTTTTPPATPPSGSGGSTGGGPSTGSRTSTSGPGASAGSASAKPVVSGPRVTAASANSATIGATVSTGGTGTAYSVQFGTTPALGHSVTGALSASATSLSATIRGLRAGQSYYLRIVASNAAGSATSATIHFRPSPVTIASVRIRGGRLHAALRCHGSAPCRVRLQARSGSRLIGAGVATVRGNRTGTVALRLSRAGTHPVLSVLSSWNGYPAAVTATA